MNRAERRRKAKTLVAVLRCKGCGVELHRVKVNRRTEEQLANLPEAGRALEAHKATTGCSGLARTTITDAEVGAALGRGGPFPPSLVADTRRLLEAEAARPPFPEVHGVDCPECYPTGAPPLNPNAHKAAP